jgi:hypothetical protein
VIYWSSILEGCCSTCQKSHASKGFFFCFSKQIHHQFFVLYNSCLSKVLGLKSQKRVSRLSDIVYVRARQAENVQSLEYSRLIPLKNRPLFLKKIMARRHTGHLGIYSCMNKLASSSTLNMGPTFALTASSRNNGGR